MDLISQLYNELKSLISNITNLDINDLKDISWSLNTEINKEQFGDISTNVALVVSKKLGQNPREFATKIIDKLQENKSIANYVDRFEIAGPGFINIFLSNTALTELAKELFAKKEEFFKSQSNNPKKINIEFISANPTGPLHFGHGRGGIIGDVLGNILEFQNNNVTKEFYINDAGNQITKLGESLKIRFLQELGQQDEMPEGYYQGQYLKDLAKTCLKQYGSEIKDQPIEFFSNYAKEHLLQDIKQTLDTYGIIYNVWFSEKHLHTSGAIENALESLKDKGFLYKSDGALWFKSTEFGDDKDRVVKKQTGDLTYAAADIAYLENKLKRGYDELIMILGQDHHSYVQRLKGIMSALGYDNNRLNIILYQLVTLKESGATLRMSKRAGRSITLKDVIDTVGTDVARFFYLNRKADAHLDFDVDLALKHTDENPVYYIQYAYVRTLSILSKANQEDRFQNINVEDSKFIGSNEKILLKKIISLKDLLKNICLNHQTHLLSYYVIELAQLFHSYYNANKVIIADLPEQSRGRLLLIMIVRDALKTCFKLLGINAPTHM